MILRLADWVSARFGGEEGRCRSELEQTLEAATLRLQMILTSTPRLNLEICHGGDYHYC